MAIKLPGSRSYRFFGVGDTGDIITDKIFQSISALQRVWDKIGVDELRKIADNIPKHHQACVDANGGHFEI